MWAKKKSGQKTFKPEEDYHKPVRTGNAFSSNYIWYESNENKDKMLSV